VSALVEPEFAMRQLARRQWGAIGMLFLRVVLLSVLSTALRIQIPALRSVQPLVDAVSGMLALWPFWTAVGRNWQWRIALGRAYADAGRPADAVRVLAALDGVQGKLFDAQGTGAAVLARSREALA